MWSQTFDKVTEFGIGFFSYKCSKKVPKHLWSTLWTIGGNNNDICIDHVIYEEALYYSELRFDSPNAMIQLFFASYRGGLNSQDSIG